MSPGNVVFNRIPLRFKGKPCNKLRYLPAWKAIASIGKGPFEWLTTRTGRGQQNYSSRLARLRRIVVGRCYISHETATGKWKCPVIPRKIDDRVRIGRRNRHTFHVGFARRYSMAFRENLRRIPSVIISIYSRRRSKQRFTLITRSTCPARACSSSVRSEK